MNGFKQVAWATVIAALALVSNAVFAQDHTSKQAAQPPQPAGQSSAPGEVQAFLAKRAGEYARSIRFVGQTGEWAGSSKISVILGGRFILEENHDTVFGRPVEGMRIYGYNNAAKQFQMISMYTMSTAITNFTGTSNDGGRTVEFSAISNEPRGEAPLHAEMRQIDDDHFVVTLSTAGADGKQTPFQETTYTRKK